MKFSRIGWSVAIVLIVNNNDKAMGTPRIILKRNSAHTKFLGSCRFTI